MVALNETSTEPQSAVDHRRIRWHRHVLAALVIWSGMFLAGEAVRIYTMHRVEELNVDGECDTIVRYVSLEADSPVAFRKLAERAGGPYWNQDFCSITIYGRGKQLDDELIFRTTRLGRLCTLQISGATLTDAQLDQLGRMKNLQWLALVSTNVQPARAAELRRLLPNTFVTLH